MMMRKIADHFQPRHTALPDRLLLHTQSRHRRRASPTFSPFLVAVDAGFRRLYSDQPAGLRC